MPRSRDLFGHAISPAQHRYLENSDTAPPGNQIPHTKASDRPNDNSKRLLAVSLQNLSRYRGEPPSEYFDVTLREGQTLDLAFTHAQVPRGHFSWNVVYEHHSPNSALHLNTANNDYYQNGIPGIADSIEELADWIRSVISALGKHTVRAIGSSIAAYAALLFGDRVNADFIFAFSPIIGGGVRFLGRKVLCRPLGDALLRVRDRSVITFGAFELNDYSSISHCLEAGLDLNDFSLLASGHGSQSSLRLDRMLLADGGVGAHDLLRNVYSSPLDEPLINRLATVLDLVDERRHADIIGILASASDVDTLNPEFQYRLSVHLHLAGRLDDAIAAAQQAVRLKVYHNALAGFDVLGADTDFRRKLLHDYSKHLGFGELKAIADLFDDVSRSTTVAAAPPPVARPPSGHHGTALAAGVRGGSSPGVT